MAAYSALLATSLIISAPWWLWRMAASGRYRAGLAQRLGRVPRSLQSAVTGEQVVWVHAVSVGEVLGALRLVNVLRQRFRVVVSTTTLTGQTVAQQKLPEVQVFYLPLDFAFAVRPYLRVLRPRLLVLVESEFWPRLLVECERASIPVVVVNARISDRSYPKYLRLRRLWRPLLAMVRMFLAQGAETARRLQTIGVSRAKIQVIGNLKYDAPEPIAGPIFDRVRTLADGRPVVIAGSTLAGEELLVLAAWKQQVRPLEPETLLVLAPRHPERFRQVEQLAQDQGFCVTRASSNADTATDLVLLDTVGDLAAIYQIASVAFIGGSLLPRGGGHNPLEAARFAVPVLLGPSYENFREIVDAMVSADAVHITTSDRLGEDILTYLRQDYGLGARGRRFYESQAGATERAFAALLKLVP